MDPETSWWTLTYYTNSYSDEKNQWTKSTSNLSLKLKNSSRPNIWIRFDERDKSVLLYKTKDIIYYVSLSLNIYKHLRSINKSVQHVTNPFSYKNIFIFFKLYINLISNTHLPFFFLIFFYTFSCHQHKNRPTEKVKKKNVLSIKYFYFLGKNELFFFS